MSKVTFTVNGEELTLTTEHLKIASDTYSGRVVYAENSMYLLDYEISESSAKPSL